MRLTSICQIAITVGVLSAAFVLLVQRGGRWVGPKPSVRFVLPDAYHGVFRLDLAQQGQKVEMFEGVYVYNIPEMGALAVSDFAPLERWHQQTASYRNGMPIPQESSADDEVALRGSVATSTGSIYFAIGTKREAQEWLGASELAVGRVGDRENVQPSK